MIKVRISVLLGILLTNPIKDSELVKIKKENPKDLTRNPTTKKWIYK